MVYCTECGAQNNDTARFCINCGRPLVPPKRQRRLGRNLLIAVVVLVVAGAIAGGVYYVMHQLPSGGQWIA
jgi:ribosomal protein L40E